MQRRSPALGLVLLALGVLGIAGAPTEIVDGSREGASLDFGQRKVYTFVVPRRSGGYPTVEVVLSQVSKNGQADVFCRTGDAGKGGKNAPGPGNFMWRTNFTTGGDTIELKPEAVGDHAETMEVEDPVYVCAVVAVGDPDFRTEFELELALEYATPSLAEEERAIMREVYQACCRQGGDCEKWPRLQSHFPTVAFADDDGDQGEGVELDGVVLDFCHVRGCECNTEGRLRVLDLDFYGLKCPFPSQFGLLDGLAELHLSSNILGGDIQEALASLSGLRRLQNLTLRKNSMQGRLDGGEHFEQEANAFCRMASRLQQLDLEENVIEGSLPACTFSGTLGHFTISSNLLTGTLPPVADTDLSMEVLSAGNNQLTGPIPESFGNLSKLQHIDLSNNVLTGEVPPSLVALPDLVFLLLASNELSGKIPDNVADSDSLQVIRLNDNQFNVMPDRWLHSQGSKQLSILDISHNQLAGTFPLGLSRSPNLSTLSLQDNNLYGALPPVEGLFPKAVRLEFHQNHFEGPIPEEWSSLGMFEGALDQDALPLIPILDLSDNMLTGDFPEFLDPRSADFPSRLRVYLGGNELSCGDRFDDEVGLGEFNTKIFGVKCAEPVTLGGAHANSKMAKIASTCAAIGLPVMAAATIFFMFFVKGTRQPAPAMQDGGDMQNPGECEYGKEWGSPPVPGKLSGRSTIRTEHYSSARSSQPTYMG
ncbi:unnamed protein product [Ostreobium quekettii]|uniref:Uncharacterized protein n=1 Tax=Ostreobium quekettii TaxID=121088 RepID=A0A8S1J4Y2_9CHLO|nr:unnamed protein product [Ostreobium quekettii]|eukprot:evm.model.scf_105.4 EVM.evm.TU.scf_105.4   scf_105:55246-57896(-)